MPAPKKATSNPDSSLLAKYEHHRNLSRKHNAHADLIEAKLRVQGKRISHEYEGMSSSASKPSKRKIVKDA